MKWSVDISLISRIIIILLIGFIFFYIFYNMIHFTENNSARQTSNIEEIINKALVQCYALEGSYPENIEHVQRYGIVLDNTNYVYFYEWYGGNIKPTLYVLEK